MPVSQLIGGGLGFTPGSVKYLVTTGLDTAEASELIADICDAVVAEIQAGIIAGRWPDMETSWEYLYESQLPTDDTLRCRVTPPPQRGVELIARVGQQVRVTLAITVRQRVSDTSNATIDPIMAGVEALVSYYAQKRALTGLTGVKVWGEVDMPLVFDPNKLWQEATFEATFNAVFGRFLNLN